MKIPAKLKSMFRNILLNRGGVYIPRKTDSDLFKAVYKAGIAGAADAILNGDSSYALLQDILKDFKDLKSISITEKLELIDAFFPQYSAVARHESRVIRIYVEDNPGVRINGSLWDGPHTHVLEITWLACGIESVEIDIHINSKPYNWLKERGYFMTLTKR